MPRIARVIAVGMPHHVTQRGNYRQVVFRNKQDRLLYLSWMEEYSEKYSLNVIAFCLMINHVHFIVIPENENALSKVFNTVHMRYSQYFNRTNRIAGHLWQGRFYSCVLSEPHFISAVRYVERNPVRAKLTENAWDWTWSSAAYHINRKEKPLIKLSDSDKYIETPERNWQEYLSLEEEPYLINNIRKYSLSGRPLGNEVFIRKLEEKLGKQLWSKKWGKRPY